MECFSFLVLPLLLCIIIVLNIALDMFCNKFVQEFFYSIALKLEIGRSLLMLATEEERNVLYYIKASLFMYCY